MRFRTNFFHALVTVLCVSVMTPSPASEVPARIIEDAIASLDLEPTPCRGDTREEWSGYDVFCAQFDGPLCECNARWHDEMLERGFSPVDAGVTRERFFPERRDQFFTVGKIAYVMNDYPVLALTHEYDHQLVIAVSRTTDPDASSKVERKVLFPRLHPIQEVDMLVLDGPVFSSVGPEHHAQLVHKVEPEDPRTADDSPEAVSLVLVFGVDMQGEVFNVFIQEPRDVDAKLAEAAIAAVTRWRFSPARQCGLPSSDLRSFRVDFPALGE